MRIAKKATESDPPIWKIAWINEITQPNWMGMFFCENQYFAFFSHLHILTRGCIAVKRIGYDVRDFQAKFSDIRWNSCMYFLNSQIYFSPYRNYVGWILKLGLDIYSVYLHISIIIMTMNKWQVDGKVFWLITFIFYFFSFIDKSFNPSTSFVYLYDPFHCRKASSLSSEWFELKSPKLYRPFNDHLETLSRSSIQDELSRSETSKLNQVWPAPI